MTEFDDVMADIDMLGDELPMDDVSGDLDMAAPTDPSLAVTEGWTAEVWGEIDIVEADVAGADVALPDPFQPASGFSAGIAVGGWLARRRARRASADR